MQTSSHNPLLVRAARATDAAALATLARQLLAHEQAINELMGPLRPWAASEAELRKQLRRADTRFFVAERAGAIVGYLKLIVPGYRFTRSELGWARWLKDRVECGARTIFNFVLRRPQSNVAAGGGYIAGAFVGVAARRTGIGRALVAAAESWLRAHDIPTGELHVLVANDAAHRFWRSVGYEPLTLGMRKKL